MASTSTVADSAAPARTRDFPIYRDLSPNQWLMVLACCAVGFAALVAPIGGDGLAGRWMRSLLFVVLPLIGLRFAAGHAWTRFVAPPRGTDLLIGLAMVPVVMVLSFGTAFVVREVSATAANPIGGQMAALPLPDLILFFVTTAPQLLGEEIITLLPFLAILGIGHVHLDLSRRNALLIAWIASAVLFGALHLPTYDWHPLQAIGIIGMARVALTLTYVLTKNLWAATVTHVANDWTLFAIPFVLAPASV